MTVKVALNDNAVRALLLSSEVQAELDRHAEAIANRCNEQSSWGGYDWESAPGGIRGRSHVWAEGYGETRQQRLAHNLDAGS